MTVERSRTVAAYLVKGDDPVVVDDAVRTLVDELVGEEEPGLIVEDLVSDDYELAAVVDAAQTPPFLTGRRVVVARGIGRFGSAEVQGLVDYLAQPLETTALVMVSGGGQVAPRLVSAVKQVGNVVDVGVRDARSQKGWVSGRLQQSTVRLDARASALVAEHVGEDAGRLVGLVNVLEGVYGEGARLTPVEVEPFLGEAGGVAPWGLTDAIDTGDTATALAQLRRMLVGGGRHPLVVLASLHSHYSRILRLEGGDVTDEAEAASRLGLKGSTFPARKALAQARRLGHPGITRAITLLADADLALKGTTDWPEDLVLEVLVARLCHLVPRRAASGSRRRR